MNILKEFCKQHRQVNKIVKELKRKGINLELAVSYQVFLKKKMVDLCIIEKKCAAAFSDKLVKILLTDEQLKTFANDYLQYLNTYTDKYVQKEDNTPKVRNNYSEYAKRMHVYSSTPRFRSKPFILFIKDRIWDMDLEKPSEQLLWELVFDWYDLEKRTRKIYTKMGKAVEKKYKNEGPYFHKDRLIEHICDIDLAWNSDEEWCTK